MLTFWPHSWLDFEQGRHNIGLFLNQGGNCWDASFAKSAGVSWPSSVVLLAHFFTW